jgi:hypothetical protein
MLQHGRRSGNYYLIPLGPRNPGWYCVDRTEQKGDRYTRHR